MWCVAPLEMNEGTHLGVRVQSVFGCSAEKAPLSGLLSKCEEQPSYWQISSRSSSCGKVRTQNFSFGGADPEATYNVYDFKKILKNCYINLIVSVRVIKDRLQLLLYTHKHNYMLHDSLTLFFFILSKEPQVFFYFICPNSNVLVFTQLQSLIWADEWMT